MLPGEGHMRVLLRRSGWNLRVKAKPLRFVVKWFFLDHHIIHEYNSMELQGCFEALFFEAC